MLHKLFILILLCCLFSSCGQNTNHFGVTRFQPDSIFQESNLDFDKVNKKDDIDTQSATFQQTQSDRQDDTYDNFSPPSHNDIDARPPQSQSPLEPQKPNIIPDTPIHEHVFVPIYKTIVIDEVGHYEQILVSEGYDLPIYRQEERSICNNCGLDITYFEWNHIEESLLNDGDCTSFHTTYIDILEGYQHVDAIYEQQYVIDSPSSQQIVIDYYQCQCGQKK